MELKKSHKANLERWRGLFLEIGLLIALSVSLLAFEWKVAPAEEVEENSGPIQAVMEMEDIVPITRQEDAPPPPPEPPKVTDILDIVADDVVVDTNLEINMEADFSTEIIPVVFDASASSSVVIEEEEEVILFAIIEDKPTFQGKDAETGFRDWVGKNTQYPAVAQENGITGRVFIEFTIDKDGSLTDIKILRGVDPLLDAEAMRVIKMSPKWQPGMQRGKAVKVKYTFPFFFQLNN